MSNHLKARNVPAIQGGPPPRWLSGSVRDKAGSCFPCPGDPRPPEAWLGCRAPVTSPLRSPGPSRWNLTARGAVFPGPGLAVLEHQTPPGQPSPAAWMHLSGRRQARKRPTAARRWEALTRLPGPELCGAQQPPCTPSFPPRRRPTRPAGSFAPGGLAPRGPLLPAGPCLLTPRNWKFMPPALQPSAS